MLTAVGSSLLCGMTLFANGWPVTGSQTRNLNVGVVSGRGCIRALCNVRRHILSENATDLGSAWKITAVCGSSSKAVAAKATEEEVFVATDWTAQCGTETMQIVGALDGACSGIVCRPR